jgi:hypothetical protein
MGWVWDWAELGWREPRRKIKSFFRKEAPAGENPEGR